MMRSRMYGIHNSPVRITVSISHNSSLDIIAGTSVGFGGRQKFRR